MSCPACKVVLCSREHKIAAPGNANELKENMLRDVCMAYPVCQSLGALKTTDESTFNQLLTYLDMAPMDATARDWVESLLDTICTP